MYTYIIIIYLLYTQQDSLNFIVRLEKESAKLAKMKESANIRVAARFRPLNKREINLRKENPDIKVRDTSWDTTLSCILYVCICVCILVCVYVYIYIYRYEGCYYYGLI